MNKLKLLLIFITGFNYEIFAQSKLQIRIINQAKDPVSYATTRIKSIADSSYFFNAVSDTLGIVIFPSIKTGQYIINISSVNYAPLQKGIATKEGPNQFTITLDAADSKMNAVVVTANRPLFRQEDDKTIVDPEVLAASSTNAYEILEQTPGLFVDQDGNIYLNSTRPATVYINGREQKMSAADIATMLKNLPPNAIASIEILSTPSARYDASGSGGIVNVVLKKGTRIGMTGSVTFGMNQGTYGNQFAGLNINNNNGRVTTYFNFQVGNRNNYEDLKTDRLFSVDSILGQDAFTKYNNRNVYGGYGISLPLSSKWDFSYDGRVSYGKQDNNSSNLSKISHKFDTQPAYSNFTAFNNKINNLNINQGLNLRIRSIAWVQNG
jgi:iron complex outermembrane recepter protein